MNRYFKFPEMWRIVLNARPATAADWKIAAELLNRAKFSPVVKFSNEAAAKLGISPKTRQRSLNRLGRWGLIDFRPQPGKTRLITVHWLSGRQPFHTRQDRSPVTYPGSLYP